MKSGPRPWKDGRSKEITFIVTKDCQLACKYCYLVGKNSKERMSWATAKRTVDYILSLDHEELCEQDSVVFDFIGGEPFLEIDLIDHICDYIESQMRRQNHHWAESYMFSMTTNGINYDSSKVQEFIKKHASHLSITITLDGTPQKHNLNRIWKSIDSCKEKERGSYDDVARNIPLWLSQFPDAATKVTISSADIPYICESVLHLFGLGIHNVNINCVFENVWSPGDDVLFEQQLRMLADAMIVNKLYEDNYCSFFDRSIGRPLDYRTEHNWCGAGMMLSIDAEGKLYPCTRFAKYSLREKSPRIIGNVYQGVDQNMLRPFKCLTRSIQSTKECFECQVASGCAWCQGENYDAADSETIFQRSTAICKMHKARVRANEYFWSRIDGMVDAGKIAVEPVDNMCRLDKTVSDINTVVVLLSTKSTSYCISEYQGNEEILMPLPILQDIVGKAKAKNWNLIFAYPQNELPSDYKVIIDGIAHKSIVPWNCNVHGDAVVVDGLYNIEHWSGHASYIILRVSLSDFCKNTKIIDNVLQRTDRLEIVFSDEASFSKDDDETYREAMNCLVELVYSYWQKGRRVEVNLLTDRLQLAEMDNCEAGCKSVTFAPNGNFYICPAFYYHDENDICGNITDGISIKNPLLYTLSHSPLCAQCGAFHCKRCVFLNRMKTKEVNIPSYEQCRKMQIEMDATKRFYEVWKRNLLKL